MKKWFPIMMASAAICACGCSKSQSSEPLEVPTAPVEAVDSAHAAQINDAQNTIQPPAPDETADNAAYLAALTAPADETLIQQWTAANNDFGLKMLRTVQMDKSSVISPYSAERALGMTLDGAAGTTASELKSALSMPDAANISAAGAHIEKLVVNSNNPDTMSIRIDNRLWVRNGLKLLDSYTSAVHTNYSADPVQLDFVNDPDGSRKTINDDIAKSTENKILDLLKPGVITPDTRSVLTSAIYFKAPWRDKFVKEATKKDKFYAVGGEVQLDMMRHAKAHPYMANDDMTALELDFVGNFSLLIAMPNLTDNAKGAEALDAMEKTLTGEKLVSMHTQMRSGERPVLQLTMPKFRIEYGDSLAAMLKSFGVQTAFDETKADFSRMTTDEKLYISDVIQKAYIDVNEDGAEAAAATAVIMATRAMMKREEKKPIVVNVDHPFMYALVENSTGTALFMGRYLGK